MIRPEENVYTGVYRVLLGGMLASTALFAVGVALALLHPAYVPLDAAWVLSHYHWRVVIAGLASGDPAAYMMLATILLILTPVARVAVSLYAFAVDGDRKYVIVTGIVLLVMAATVVASRLGLR